ncbi:MAG: hypothetical protein ACTSW4_07380 [Candidatus Ranarchaeia archaeon]
MDSPHKKLDNGTSAFIISANPNPSNGPTTFTVINNTILSTLPKLNITMPNGTLQSYSLTQVSSSNWSTQFVPHLEGEYNVTVYANDSTDHIVHASTVLVIDKTPPVVSILSFEVDFAFVNGRVLRIMVRNNTEPVSLTCTITTPTNETYPVTFEYLVSCRCWSGYIQALTIGTYTASVNATDIAGNSFLATASYRIGPDLTGSVSTPGHTPAPDPIQTFISFVPLIVIVTFVYIALLGVAVFYIKAPDVD